MVEIIKANTTHAEVIGIIGKEAFSESHGHSASKEDILYFISKAYHTQTIIEDIENKKVAYYLIYSDGELAGFSKIELDSPNENITDLNITKLDRLYLLKAFYGKQLGAKLFDFNVEFSKRNNQKGIWLAVWTENEKGLNFYNKKGFKIVGEHHYKISETHYNPNHIMYLEY
ncbi:GNAT family N-acetyltransferase [Lacinutrix undariae]